MYAEHVRGWLSWRSGFPGSLHCAPTMAGKAGLPMSPPRAWMTDHNHGRKLHARHATIYQQSSSLPLLLASSQHILTHLIHTNANKTPSCQPFQFSAARRRPGRPASSSSPSSSSSSSCSWATLSWLLDRTWDPPPTQSYRQSTLRTSTNRPPATNLLLLPVVPRARPPLIRTRMR